MDELVTGPRPFGCGRWIWRFMAFRLAETQADGSMNHLRWDHRVCCCVRTRTVISKLDVTGAIGNLRQTLKQ